MSLEFLVTTLIVGLLPGAGVIQALAAARTRSAGGGAGGVFGPAGPVAGRLMLRSGKRPLLR